LDRGKFDAVISDLPMAGISGVDLLQATRKNHPNSAFLMARSRTTFAWELRR